MFIHENAPNSRRTHTVQYTMMWWQVRLINKTKTSTGHTKSSIFGCIENMMKLHDENIQTLVSWKSCKILAMTCKDDFCELCWHYKITVNIFCFHFYKIVAHHTLSSHSTPFTNHNTTNTQWTFSATTKALIATPIHVHLLLDLGHV